MYVKARDEKDILKGLLEVEIEMFAGIPVEDVVGVVPLVMYRDDVLVRIQLNEERLVDAVDESDGLYVL